MLKIRVELAERLQYEPPFVKKRVRDFQRGLSQHHGPVEEQIDVDGSRPPTRFFVAAPTELTFDLLGGLQEQRRNEL